MSSERKTCTICKKNKPTSEFYFDPFHKKFRANCRLCHIKEVYKYIDPLYYKTPAGRRAMRKYASTQNGKNKINEASRRSYLKHREKWDARNKLRYAVKIGIIEKLKICQKCEEMKPLQGHHPDYTKPLDVVWLCAQCHAQVHRLSEKQQLTL